ncbi:hypothetical protein [Amycolatopsis sp. cmx-4-83]|uniref:hypothetical protein n=1 Tax=Amycolatopsis sp. cmx-4-83 TaxID=2790940 RepID=UPI00397CF036
MAPTREERIVRAAFDLASELAGSWGLAVCRGNAGYEQSLYGRLVMFGPAGEALCVESVKRARPWAYTIRPVLPYDEDQFSTGWTDCGEYVDHRLKYPAGWFFPDDQRPRPVLIETRTPPRDVADRLEEDVLPSYRNWLGRIRERNIRRRERLAEERDVTLSLAQAFGGPVRVVPVMHNATRCTLADGRSSIELRTCSPDVRFSIVVSREHAAEVADDLAKLLGIVPS